MSEVNAVATPITPAPTDQAPTTAATNALASALASLTPDKAALAIQILKKLAALDIEQIEQIGEQL